MRLTDNKIYLASKSPRRRELLRQVGVEFELLLLRDRSPRGPDVSEEILPGEKAEDYVARVAREKAEYGAKVILWRRLPLRPVLAADTTVVVDGRILGKPTNSAEAMEMLQLLSGRTHQVLTSVALHFDDTTPQVTQTSDVTFTALCDDTIRTYCVSPEPYDKAGGYAVQGLAAAFIERIAGSYSGIMGLPLYETAQLLKQASIQII
ncbi:MAG TPA: Maf family protein [Noviherbaspirillum sp.]